jgi:predicted enzyme related to lactoylglutathione lyase
MGGRMRPFAIFASGLLVGLAIQSGSAQQRDFLALNHVAMSVDDFDAASKFYTETMGLPIAFSFTEPDGSPYLTYFQVNRETFIELMPATPARPKGFVHFGLQVADIDETVKRLRARGMQVRDANVSPRTRSRIATATTPQGTAIEILEFGPESLHRKVMDAWK